ncbi:alpha-ketoacid dehydrogenase subunit beta [Chloroflexota bacterium]
MTTVLEAINSALYKALDCDEHVLLIGEDLLDPYGGAFKVTRGLSSAFPGRVLTTPISESGFLGMATGMALRGMRPVVELMFGDFTTLIADQLINHATKFRWMYNDQVRVPLVIRTPMGGRRGYGPTHSQTLEKHFIGAPGLWVLAPNAISDPGKLLLHAIFDLDDPVLFIENKLLYSKEIGDVKRLKEFTIKEENKHKSSIRSSLTLSLRESPPPKLTIVAYGYMSELARQATLRLAYESEIFTELVIPTQISPFEINSILDSVQSTGRMLVVEEGTRTLGWGAEIIARAFESAQSRLISADRLTAPDLPIPASVPLETKFLPGVEDIIDSAKLIVKRVP